MENQFVPYELAVKLKELGFNKECCAYYSPMDNKLSNIGIVPISSRVLKAPLWQQAFDWLWNKTNKYIIPIPNDDKEWLCLGQKFKTYPEARQACLEKLIEVVENKNLK